MIAARRAGLVAALAVLVCAACTAQAQPVNETRSTSKSRCGVQSNGQLCKEPTNCCAKWGVCGIGEKYCGVRTCVNGPCYTVPPPLASPTPVPPPPPPRPTSNVVPDSIVEVGQELPAYAGCGEVGTVMSLIIDPIFGNAQQGCNASDSYSIVAAGCLGQTNCVVRASTDVFEDACPGILKTLQFGFTCEPETNNTLPPGLPMTVMVNEDNTAYAGCDQPGTVITSIIDPKFGNPDTSCNATNSYSVIAASCLGQSACVIRASIHVFEDACLGVWKILQFSFTCGASPAPPSSPAPPVASSPLIEVVFMDESTAYVDCDEPGAVIANIVEPVYGNEPRGCNSTDSYSIVAAACLGMTTCALRASSDVFTDACPGTDKILHFKYECELVTTPLPPPPPPVSADIYIPVVVSQGGTAYAGCDTPGNLISHIVNPLFGNVGKECNSTDSYSLVAASCLGQPSCRVQASSDVFTDPCPGTWKTLQFGFKCESPAPTPVASSPPPPLPSSPPPIAQSPPPPSTSPSPPTPSPAPTPPAHSPGPPPTQLPSPPPPTQLTSPPPPTQSSSPPPLAQSSSPPPASPVSNPLPPNPSPNPFPPAASPSPPPPAPSPSPPPPPPSPTPPAPANEQGSLLWGRSGELYRAGGRLGDWSQAGYAAAERPIPYHPNKFNVKDFGARGDGSVDDSDAIQNAINAASIAARANQTGMAVYMPSGMYKIMKRIVITQSNVTLRGSSVAGCQLWFPVPLQSIYGADNWAFGGAFLSIVGKRMSSFDVTNSLTAVTGEANRGQYRLQVGTTGAIRVGQWVRLWMPAAAGNSRRRLQGAGFLNQQGGRHLSQAPPVPAGKVTVLEAAPEGPAVPKWFDDPMLQTALEAAVAAEWDVASQLEANPDKVPAQSLEPNATNPLGLDPMLLAAVRYASIAMESDAENATDADPDKVPAQALPNTLEYYLYGNNKGIDSGTPSAMFPGKERVRFVSRVVAVGSDWVEFERPLPYDVRLKWKPVLHRFAPAVTNSGFENFRMNFKYSTYPSHLDVKGNNGIALYDVANSWVRNVQIINADNGVIASGVDFVTISDVKTDFPKPRGTGRVADVNGHHALWTSSCSNVLVTRFSIPQPWFHDLSVDSFAESTAYTNGWGANINIDCHRAAVHNNLFSNIDIGLGARAFNSGGDVSRGSHAGANTTWWNLRTSSKGPVGLPPCDFGPMLNFFGSWLSPGTSKSRRLLQVAEGGSTSAGVEMPVAVPAGSSAGSAPVAAPAPREAVDVVTAMAAEWCVREGWWVEQLAAGKVAGPADLHSAQVAARQAGTMR